MEESLHVFDSSSDQGSERSGAGTNSESEYHRLLSSSRRRLLLDVLEDRSTPIAVDELARAIADRSGEEDVDRIAIALHHKHLPKLSEVDVVEYDPGESRVTSFQRLAR